MKRSELKRTTPLKADPEKTREWQQRSRKPLPQGSGLKSNSPALERTPMTRKPTAKKIAYEAALDALTPDLIRRSRGVCEVRWPGICTGNAVHRHHRQMGRGKGTQDDVLALLHVCDACHSKLHSMVDTSRAHGYLVKRSQNPAEIPVLPIKKIV